MNLTLLFLLITFFASVAGLIGKSWDDTKQSRIKFTPRGWISLLIIVCGLGLSTYKAIQDKKENDRATIENNKLRAFVYNKISDDCTRLIHPIVSVYFQNVTKVDYNLTTDSNKTGLFFCKKITSENAMNVFESSDFLEEVKEGTAFEEWDVSFANYYNGYYSQDVEKDLEKTLTTWSFYIDKEDLALIDSIVNDGFITTLKCVSKDAEYRKNFKSFYWYEDDDILNKQNEFINKIAQLYQKAIDVNEKVE